MAGEPALIMVAARPAGSFGWSWPGGLTLAVLQRSPGAGVGGRSADGRPVQRRDRRAAAGRRARRARAFASVWGACAAVALMAACTVFAVREPAVPRRA